MGFQLVRAKSDLNKMTPINSQFVRINMKAKPILAISALALSLIGIGQAQTTFATLTGRVTDAAGAAAPKATVTARNVETGIETTAEPNSEGIYTLSQLKEGR